MKIGVIVVALLALLAPIACGEGDGGDSDGPAARTSAENAAALRSEQWLFTDGADLSFGSGGPTIEFGAEQVGGSDGCNQFGAPFRIDGSSMTIEAQRVTSTMMACEVDDEEFIAALGEVEEWELDGSQLILSGGDTELRFQASSPAGAWTASSILHGDAVTTLLPGSEITATFGPEGELEGSAGCNSYGGTYERLGSAIAIRELFATEMACETPAGVMEQEQSYLDALAKAAAFRIESVGSVRTLKLLSEKGTILATFEPGS